MCRVASAFDEAEASHARFRLRREPAAVQQLAFQGGEEALADGVVVGSPTDPMNGRTPAFRHRSARRQGCVLESLVGIRKPGSRSWTGRAGRHTAPISLANQAAARGKTSRSTRGGLFSRRSHARASPFSSRRPLGGQARTSQAQIDCAVGSNSRARSSASRPARTRSTVWQRNSGKYGRCVLSMEEASCESRKRRHQGRSILGGSDDFTEAGRLWRRVGRSLCSWAGACRSGWPRA